MLQYPVEESNKGSDSLPRMPDSSRIKMLVLNFMVIR
jgi:hypothetical protein